MKDGNHPNPNTFHPIVGYDKEIYVKPSLKNPNIIVGDFTYIADSDFESHVTHLYEWNGDKLIELLEKFAWWDKSIREKMPDAVLELPYEGAYEISFFDFTFNITTAESTSRIPAAERMLSPSLKHTIPIIVATTGSRVAMIPALLASTVLRPSV